MHQVGDTPAGLIRDGANSAGTQSFCPCIQPLLGDGRLPTPGQDPEYRHQLARLLPLLLSFPTTVGPIWHKMSRSGVGCGFFGARQVGVFRHDVRCAIARVLHVVDVSPSGCWRAT